MQNSVYSVANKIGDYVNSTIIRLQSGSLDRGPCTSSARASLAKLRRFGMPGAGSWISTGYDILSGLPDFGLSRRDEQRMLKAVACALKLYAYHQQSNNESMALLKYPEGSHPRTFGWSCWRLRPNADEAKGVLNRMASIEAAADFDGVEVHLRALISQMNGEKTKVDYRLLARDLYLMQFEGCHDDVFLHWARDYFSGHRKEENAADEKN